MTYNRNIYSSRSWLNLDSQLAQFMKITVFSQENEDELRHYWKTEKEETEEGFSSPVHAVALRNGNVFMFFPLCHDSQEPKNPSKIAAILGNIRKAADGTKSGQRCI